MVEVLKQGQFVPVHVADQVLIIYAGNNGYLDEVELDDVHDYERRLLQYVHDNHQDFRDVMALVWTGKLRPVVDRVMGLSEGRAAFEVLERGEQFGKIVLAP